MSENGPFPRLRPTTAALPAVDEKQKPDPDATSLGQPKRVVGLIDPSIESVRHAVAATVPPAATVLPEAPKASEGSARPMPKTVNLSVIRFEENDADWLIPDLPDVAPEPESAGVEFNPIDHLTKHIEQLVRQHAQEIATKDGIIDELRRQVSEIKNTLEQTRRNNERLRADIKELERENEKLTAANAASIKTEKAQAEPVAIEKVPVPVVKRTFFEEVRNFFRGLR